MVSIGKFKVGVYVVWRLPPEGICAEPRRVRRLRIRVRLSCYGIRNVGGAAYVMHIPGAEGWGRPLELLGRRWYRRTRLERVPGSHLDAGSVNVR